MIPAHLVLSISDRIPSGWLFLKGQNVARHPCLMKKFFVAWGAILPETVCLAPSRLRGALTALRRFRAIANRLNVDKLHVVATAAAREQKMAAILSVKPGRYVKVQLTF